MGVHAFDIYFSNLDATLEFNVVKPYTYAHRTNATNYTHFNQPLAHPLGANFRELIGILRYKPLKNLVTRAKLIYAVKGDDTNNTNYGGDIFKDYTTFESEFGNFITQGIASTLIIADLLVSFEVKHNLNIDFNLVNRRWMNGLSTGNRQTTLAALGVRLNLPHSGYDY
jgi:hypothetical protein